MSAAEITDPLLKQRAEAEIPMLQKVEKEHARKVYVIPWISENQILQSLISKQITDVAV
jgi:hypothetical protein